MIRRRLSRMYHTALDAVCDGFGYIRAPRPSGSREEAECADYLKGRRVVVVGPAPTVIGSGQGASIDAFDRVVRINHALPVVPDLIPDVGARTEILYHNLWREQSRAMPHEQLVPLLSSTVQWLCAVNPYFNGDHPFADDIDAFLLILGERLPFRTVSPRAYVGLKWRMRTRPNAGISAIQDLLSFDIRELYLTGFTFFQSEKDYQNGYRGEGYSSWHNQGSQIDQMRTWIRSDPRISVDGGIREVIFAKP